MKELPKVYDPGTVEKRIYDMWQSHGCFKGVIDPDKKPFSIVMPPPNVTGQLHMGHALDSTLQDILIRYKRMQGYAALWLPGTDHAGIATQIKVEEELRVKEGLTRYDLGREKFLERVWDWKNKYGDRIVEQQKVLGASCDWDRSAFTMDETRARSVRETFCELYEKGLIYKGSRIINWCPKCRTALSDAEVEYKEMPGSFWHIRYPIEDSDEEFIIATTRPETMLGVAAGKIYDFIWDDYCDWYIELTKPRLNGDDETAKEGAQRVLLYVLVEILKLLHPFMPFITEEIWQALPHEGDALMMQSYPVYDESLNFPEDETSFGMVMDAIKAVRARRAEMNVPPSRKSHLIIVTDKAKAFTDGEKFICKLAYASGIEVRAELPESTDGMVSVITDNARMFMPMAELVDLEKERTRMEKELANAKKQLDGQIAKLANENFVSRAPEKVVNVEREKKAKLEALIENLEESLKNLG